MKGIERTLLVVLIAILAKAQAQDPPCDANEVVWHPHPTDCTRYLICFHGVVHTMRCAPTLHWSRNTTECMIPELAGCILDYRCPPFDDPLNPIFLPNEEDCQGYFVCFNGRPLERWCSPGLWWDVVNNWCTTPEHVTCDNRTVITPPPPSTLPPSTTTPLTTTTTSGGGLPPNLGVCWRHQDLFNGQTYVRSMCIINTAVDYATALTTCRNNNMNLFRINDPIVHILYHNATMFHVGGDHPGGSVISNGRRNEVTGAWTVQDANDVIEGPLLDSMNWVQTGSIDGSTNGPCFTYSGEHGGEYQGLGMPCNIGRWFVCEHDFQISTPDPTQNTVLPTTPSFTTTTTSSGGGGPNVNACAQREDLFHNGVYLKSVCIMVGGQNYDNAQNMCRNNGMELFVINSSPVQRAFRTSVTELLASHPRGFVWINGRVDDECRNWYNFDPSRRLMWNGVHWVQTDDIMGRETGDCLRFSAEHSVTEANWQSMGFDCNALSWFACEFFT